MPFNVLLLPLLGGYIFVSNWNRTRFDAKRYSGERLLLHAAIYGLVFLVISFTITLLLASRFPDLPSRWSRIVPFEYSGTSLLAFILGSGLWAPLNLIWRREGESRRTVERRGDFLEVILNRSIKETKQILLTLSTGKVYVGFATSNFDPAFDRKYIALLPTLSGYRDNTDRQVVLTNEYAKVYASLIQQDHRHLLSIADEFQLVIPVAELVSVNWFDPEVYELFSNASVPAEESLVAAESH